MLALLVMLQGGIACSFSQFCNTPLGKFNFSFHQSTLRFVEFSFCCIAFIYMCVGEMGGCVLAIACA